MTPEYKAGLMAAEQLCAERSKKYVRESKTWEADEDKASCMTSALEALECAIAIRRLYESP